MEFDRLRYLAALARTGTMRGAAGALHVTPGAVSKAIARLEEESGIQLLAPSGRGVELTDEGLWLARRAEHLVGEFAALGSDLATRRGRDTELCVATYDVFATWFPGRLARQFLPGVPLSIRERWPGEVEAAVADAVSDVGITYTPVATEGVAHREVARVPLTVVVKRGSFEGVPVTEMPFAVPSHSVSGAIGQYGPLDGWPADGPPRNVRFRASSVEARLDLCRQGEAALLLPTFVVRQHNERARSAAHLQSVDLPRSVGKLRRTVYVVRRSAAAESLTGRVRAVEAAVKAVCNPA